MKYLTIFFFLFLNNKVFSQFLEPGIGFGVLSYSGDLKRGYSLSSSSMGLEVFQRLNLSQHIEFCKNPKPSLPIIAPRCLFK